jgi:Domain of unknown function (DUF305)
MKLRSSLKMQTLAFALIVGLGAPPCLHAQAAPANEAPFLSENATAMDKMMADMAVKPTGDVDVDFAAMMIPHHQGAIDMALAQLRYGKNEQLRRIAQEIIVEQQQEIIAMRLALGQQLPPSAPAQTQATPGQPAVAPAYDHSAMSHAAMSMSLTTTK